MFLTIEDNQLEVQLLIIELQSFCPSSRTRPQYMVAHDGATALAGFHRQPRASVEVILLDRHLREREDGLVLLPLLRSSPALKLNAAIIVRSIADDPDSIHAAKVALANGFASKRRRIIIPQLVETILHI
jgi:DNA-binding NarL/FixJ family response regulator